MLAAVATVCTAGSIYLIVLPPNRSEVTGEGPFALFFVVRPWLSCVFANRYSAREWEARRQDPGKSHGVATGLDFQSSIKDPIFGGKIRSLFQCIHHAFQGMHKQNRHLVRGRQQSGSEIRQDTLGNIQERFFHMFSFFFLFWSSGQGGGGSVSSGIPARVLSCVYWCDATSSK